MGATGLEGQVPEGEGVFTESTKAGVPGVGLVRNQMGSEVGGLALALHRGLRFWWCWV